MAPLSFIKEMLFFSLYFSVTWDWPWAHPNYHKITRKAETNNTTITTVRSGQTVPLTPGLPWLWLSSIPMMEDSAIVAKNPGRGPTLCFLLYQSRVANDSCYPLPTPGSPQLPMVRSRSALEESFENERRWHVYSATHRGCKRAPGLELQCTSCSHSCLSVPPVSCSLHLCLLWDRRAWHPCMLSVSASLWVCVSLSFSLPPSSVRRQKKVLQDLPSQCPSCLFHPSRSEDSPISHLIFPSSCSSHISLSCH